MREADKPVSKSEIDLHADAPLMNGTKEANQKWSLVNVRATLNISYAAAWPCVDCSHAKARNKGEAMAF